MISPKCAIVIGNTNELMDDDGLLNPVKRDTFENFRTCLNGVTILTYDELLQKVKNLVDILKIPSSGDREVPTAAEAQVNHHFDYYEDLPF